MRPVEIVLGCALVGAGCSDAAPQRGSLQQKAAQVTTPQATAAPKTTNAREAIDFSRPISVHTAASAICTISPDVAAGASQSPDSVSGASHADDVWASADGVLRFYPPPAAWGTALTVDCVSNGQKTTTRVDLNDSTTYFTEPQLLSDAPPTVVAERPALTGDLLSLSQAELLSAHYPPRPDAATMPERYKTWVERVTKPYKILAAVPLVTAIGRYAHGAKTVPPLPGWAGQILDPNMNGPQFEEYEASMYIPSTENCNGMGCAAALWAGMGGFNGDQALIQDGVWVDGPWCPQMTCGVRSPYLFIEYASNTTAVVPLPWSALNYSKGDGLYVVGWACNSSLAVNVNGGFGCFEIEDYTTGILSAQFRQPIPSGSTYTGRTFEMIAEKPGGLAFADFGTELMQGVAWDTNGVGHDDSTDQWQLQDTQNSSGAKLATTDFPSNPGNPPADSPTQPQIGFTWWNFQ